MAQVTDDELIVTLDAESNSLAVIMKHMAGNLRSRFTDFLTTDGEKPDRNRDGEFEIGGNPGRAATMFRIGRAAGPACLRHWTRCRPDDLLKDVRVRGERLSRASQQLDRQMTHHAYHVGQIVFLAKHLRSVGVEESEHARRR